MCANYFQDLSVSIIHYALVIFNSLLSSFVQVYHEGTHFMIPWFDRPIIYDVRARPHVVESTSGSRDLQMVYSTINSFVLFFVRVSL